MEFIQPLILLAISIGLIAIPLKLLSRYQKLKKSGLPAEGIVFDLFESKLSGSYQKYPVIRFLTAKNEWITQKYESGISFSNYRKGQQLNLLYDPSNPEDFIIESGANEIILYTLITVGVLLTGVAAFWVIQIV